MNAHEISIKNGAKHKWCRLDLINLGWAELRTETSIQLLGGRMKSLDRTLLPRLRQKAQGFEW